MKTVPTAGPNPRQLPRERRMTIIAQDPSILGHDGRILRAIVVVPADRLEPGPRSHRFHVVDYQASSATLTPPADLASEPAVGLAGPGWVYDDPFKDADDRTLIEDPRFHAQNVYAIATRTLAQFENALGRRLPWSFGRHQLFIVPHALFEPNAYYDADDQAIFFGRFKDANGQMVNTCLSHDVVAHESTHAMLDALRPRYEEPGLPDQSAFHEAFADIVALLSVFSLRDVVENFLGPGDAQNRISADVVSEERLGDSALFKLAEQMGEALSGQRGSALRRSVAQEPGAAWRADVAFEEPHRRGEVLVAALMRVMLGIWRRRLKPLIHAGGLHLPRAADEGAKAADHLLRMSIRAIDYCPPVEFEFEDFLEALLVSDAVISPDDQYEYRDLLEKTFAAYDIVPPKSAIVDLSDIGVAPLYHNIHHSELRHSPDEVYSFIWANARLLGIDMTYNLNVQSVRQAVRIGPDGFVVNEIVAEYVQDYSAPAQDIAALGVTLPDGIDKTLPVQLWGGGVLIFDQFGRAKFHQSKPLQDWERQGRRLDYLARNGLVDSQGRLGFSLGYPRGQRFAEFHATSLRAEETW